MRYLHIIENLLIQCPDIKILGIVRNPLATLASWINAPKESDIIDPVDSTNISYALYQLDDRLRPDLLALEELLKTRKYQLLLVVHYFGIVHVDLIKLKSFASFSECCW